MDLLIETRQTMPNPWTGISNPCSRREVVARLRATLKRSDTIIAASHERESSLLTCTTHCRVRGPRICVSDRVSCN